MRNLEYYLNLLKRKDRNTYYHSIRVAYYSYLVGKKLNYTEEQLSFLVIAALLHDIGKLNVPNSILKKTNTLSKEEYTEIQKHPLYAREILTDYDSKLLNVICAHHERLNGSGYPYQLSGYEIPYYAQILAIADSFDAMTSNRFYNHVKTVQEAIQELFCCSTQKCNLYNYNLVSIFKETASIDQVQNYQRMKHYSA